jgi:glutathione synthase/RimK-type ligase-like ATP-grasp enzyme
MSLEKVKLEVAKKNGFKDWSDLQSTWLKRTSMSQVVHESYVYQATKLYAAQQNAELLEALLEIAKMDNKDFAKSFHNPKDLIKQIQFIGKMAKKVLQKYNQ